VRNHGALRFDRFANVSFFIRCAAAESQAGGFKFGALKARFVKAASQGAKESLATFRFPHVIARTAASDADHASRFIAHQSRGARLPSVDAKEKFHGTTTL
jgi:hypothetical protein